MASGHLPFTSNILYVWKDSIQPCFQRDSATETSLLCQFKPQPCCRRATASPGDEQVPGDSTKASSGNPWSDRATFHSAPNEWSAHQAESYWPHDHICTSSSLNRTAYRGGPPHQSPLVPRLQLPSLCCGLSSFPSPALHKRPQALQHRVIQGQQNKRLNWCQCPHSCGSICRSNKNLSQSSTASPL